MRIGRTLPPAASPIPWDNILRAGLTCFSKSTLPIEQFENNLKSYFGAKHCFLLSSGKAALTIILKALHEIYPNKDEVLIPAFTCYSVPAAIKRAGLKIKLCDLDINTLDFNRKDLQKIADEDKHNKKLLCVIPTHLFGIPSDVKCCRSMFDHDVTIIEDVAQAMGTEHQGKKLGTLGDIGFFSLGRGKVLSTMEGGIILTNQDNFAISIKKQISSLQDHSKSGEFVLVFKAAITNIFQHPLIFWFPKSLPFLHLGDTIYNSGFKLKKMSPTQSKFAINWESVLHTYQTIRKNNVILLGTLVKKKRWKNKLFPFQIQNLPLIRIPALAENEEMKNILISYSSEKGLGIMSSYPTSINEIEELKKYFHDRDYPQAQTLSRRLLTIPTHKFVRKEDYKKFLFLPEII